MQHKCARCGKITETPFKFVFSHPVFSYELYLCYECGRKIAKIIEKEGTEG